MISGHGFGHVVVVVSGVLVVVVVVQTSLPQPTLQPHWSTNAFPSYSQPAGGAAQSGMGHGLGHVVVVVVSGVLVVVVEDAGTQRPNGVSMVGLTHMSVLLQQRVYLPLRSSGQARDGSRQGGRSQIRSPQVVVQPQRSGRGVL